MKLALFAAALMLGGTAYAQTGSTDQGGAMAQPAAGAAVAADNTAPKRDARGIPVMSADAQAPSGWNAPPAVGGTGASPSAPAAPMGSAGPMPACSRTVTDNCTQTYERGRARGAPAPSPGQ